MAVIDERGRVFGLVNLIDAGVAAFVVAALAMVAVGIAVFKLPSAPEVTGAEPASQPGSETMRLVVRGKNFLPFMRVAIQPTGVSANAVRAANLNPKIPVDRYALVKTTEAKFFVESPSLGEVWLPPTVQPGTYDLVLFSETKQIGLKEAVFTITGNVLEVPDAGRQGVAHARARFDLLPEAAKLVRPGDSATPDPGAASGLRQPAAVIKSVRLVIDRLPPNLGFSHGWDVKVIETDLEIPVRMNVNGQWQYRQNIIRIGQEINFETVRYVMHGTIGEVTVSPIGNVERDASVGR